MKNAFAQAETLTGCPQAIPPVWYERLLYCKANRFSVIGADQEVRWPAYSQVMDFELELACIIGRTGVDIPRAAAAQHISTERREPPVRTRPVVPPGAVGGSDRAATDRGRRRDLSRPGPGVGFLRASSIPPAMENQYSP